MPRGTMGHANIIIMKNELNRLTCARDDNFFSHRRVIECCGLSGLGPSGFADPYAQVVILGPTGLMYVH